MQESQALIVPKPIAKPLLQPKEEGNGIYDYGFGDS